MSDQISDILAAIQDITATIRETSDYRNINIRELPEGSVSAYSSAVGVLTIP